jgi:hypothetical protein
MQRVGLVLPLACTPAPRPSPHMRNRRCSCSVSPPTHPPAHPPTPTTNAHPQTQTHATHPHHTPGARSHPHRLLHLRRPGRGAHLQRRHHERADGGRRECGGRHRVGLWVEVPRGDGRGSGAQEVWGWQRNAPCIKWQHEQQCPPPYVRTPTSRLPPHTQPAPLFSTPAGCCGSSAACRATQPSSSRCVWCSAPTTGHASRVSVCVCVCVRGFEGGGGGGRRAVLACRLLWGPRFQHAAGSRGRLWMGGQPDSPRCPVRQPEHLPASARVCALAFPLQARTTRL